jgi:hypothetical protein
MTYLNLVNNVLRRLREETTNNVNDTIFNTMVGDFVNDAKQLVEEACDWSGLRSTISLQTIVGTNQYSLVGTGDNVKVFSVINDTNNTFITYQTKDWFNNALYLQEEISGSPAYYTFDGLDSSQDTQVLLSPKPSTVETLRFDVTKRQPELVNNTDVLLVPSKPVIHLAVALLARERGETGGTSTVEYFSIADRYLSDAIAIDAAKHPEEMIYRTV